MTKPKTHKWPTKCSICKEPIDIHPLSGWAGGHNAQPINDGRCCTFCNDTVVIPARIARIYRVTP